MEDASSCIHAGPCFVHAAFMLSLTGTDNGKCTDSELTNALRLPACGTAQLVELIRCHTTAEFDMYPHRLSNLSQTDLTPLLPLPTLPEPSTAAVGHDDTPDQLDCQPAVLQQVLALLHSADTSYL